MHIAYVFALLAIFCRAAAHESRFNH